VLFEALDDPDPEVVAQAVLAVLPWASNATGMEQISRAVLNRRLQLDAAVLDGLARRARPDDLPVSLGLLRQDSLAARSLGARPRRWNRFAALIRRRRAARIAGRGEIAQLVEHTTENRGVPGSSPGLAIPPETRMNTGVWRHWHSSENRRLEARFSGPGPFSVPFRRQRTCDPRL
jgi:hypothetical protein